MSFPLTHCYSSHMDKLSGMQDYPNWRKSMTLLLQQEGLLSWIKSEDQVDITKIQDEFSKYKLRQHKERTVALLKSALSPEVQVLVEDLEDPSTIWKTLEDNFTTTARVNSIIALNEFNRVTRNYDETLPMYIARFEAAYKKVQEAGETVPETHRIYRIIQSLPAEFDYLVREFDKMNEAEFTLTKVKATIIDEYNRKMQRGKLNQEMYAANEASTSREIPKAQGAIPKTARVRPSTQRSRSKSKERKVDTYIAEHTKTDDSYSNEVLPACWDWTLDAASTAHICQNKHFFKKLNPPSPNMIVRMGTTPHEVKGNGPVVFQVRDRGRIKTVSLRNVLYVPSIHKNLISMVNMDRAGWHATLDNGFKVFDPDWRYRYTAKLVDRFYILKALRPKHQKEGKEGASPTKVDKMRRSTTDAENRSSHRPKSSQPILKNTGSNSSKGAKSDKTSKTTYAAIAGKSNKLSSNNSLPANANVSKVNVSNLSKVKSAAKVKSNLTKENSATKTVSTPRVKSNSKVNSKDNVKKQIIKTDSKVKSKSKNQSKSEMSPDRSNMKRKEIKCKGASKVVRFNLNSEDSEIVSSNNVKTCSSRPISNSRYNAVYATERNNLMLWHERLGHINVDYVRKLFKDKLVGVSGALQGKALKCEPCILAKSTRAVHPKLEQIRSKQVNELVHCDVWGPSPVASRNGHKYLLTCIDDYSRRAFCFPIKTKDEVIEKIKSFITFAERQSSRKLKVLRSDNGLEFCNRSLKQYLDSIGIKHETTSISSPQMNGVAERYNRVLFDGVRTLKIAANTPDKLWVENVMTINYLKNRTFHSSINDIPFRRWYGRKPSIRHLKRYGCVAYVHQPKDRRSSKFAPRAKRGIFVGYGIGSTGYRVWFPESNQIVESKHVTFDESLLGREPTTTPNSPLLRFLQETSQGGPLERPYALDDDDSPFGGTMPGPSTRLTSAEQQELEPPEAHHLVTRPDQDQDKEDDATDEERAGEVTGTASKQESDEGGSTSDSSDGRDFALPDTSDEEDDESEVRGQGKFRFKRFIKIRKGGATKGRKDIYMRTPTGKTLRSNIELIEYCNQHHIKLDSTLANFNRKNKYEGVIILEPQVDDIEEANFTEVIIPRTSREALSLPQAKYWKAAMDAEIETMIEREVWDPVPYNKDMKIIPTRWVYTLKRDSQSKIQTWKARLVALGNLQREGLDYDQTFSPVVNFTMIRLFMTLFMCILKWVNCLLDVKCAYLYGDIDKEIYLDSLKIIKSLAKKITY